MDDQFAARPVTAAYLKEWRRAAAVSAPGIAIGQFNWPMMVNSLLAEVERLQVKLRRENVEEAKSDPHAGFSAAELRRRAIVFADLAEKAGARGDLAERNECERLAREYEGAGRRGKHPQAIGPGTKPTESQINPTETAASRNCECGICGYPKPGRGRSCPVDHDLGKGAG
jgi:hypothetical protein